jgi:hypothetical protein
MFKQQTIAAAVIITVLTAACNGNPVQPALAPGAGDSMTPVLHSGPAITGPVNPSTAMAKLQNVRRDLRAPWMSQPALVGSALLYVSDPGTDDVNVYSYKAQKIGALVGQLTGFNLPQGLCSDGQHVWITNTLNQTVDEYAPGGTAPINVLQVGQYYPVDCSFDPTTGNLAVTDIQSTSGAAGNIALFALAKGAPTYFYSSTIYRYYFASFDNSGNLWFDGQANSTGTPFSFAELEKNANSATAVALNQPIDFPGSVQWDGTHVVVAYQNDSDAYQFAMSGGDGTRVHTTHFKAATDVAQFVIDPQTTAAFGPDATKARVVAYGLVFPNGATIVR